MHSTSQGGSMAATLLQQKTYMNGLAGSGGPDGSGPAGPGAVGSVGAAGGGGGGGVGSGPSAGATFLPVSKTLIHHLLPHNLQADHHTATGAFHHRAEHYHQRAHRGSIGSSAYGTLAPSGCEDPPASALDEIFSPLPVRHLDAAGSATTPLELGTDALWDAIGSPTTTAATADTATTTTSTAAAAAFAGQQPTVPATTNHASINNPQQHCHEQPDADCPMVAADGSDSTTTTTEQQAAGPEPGEQEQQEPEPEPEIDIVINNVVCSFSVRCHLNLHDIAINGDNVEFRRENGMVTMKLRRPYTTASIWSSGKITCTGATSEDQAKVAARRYSRCLQKLGFNVRLRNFRIVNVLGTCAMPWGIKIVNFSEKYKKDASYEPELHPGVTYKLHSPRATLKIFSTGSITVTAASVAFVQAAIEHIFPLVYEFRKKRTPHEKLELLKQPPAFDPQELELPEDGEVDLLAATGTTTTTTANGGELANVDDDDDDDEADGTLVSEDYEMHGEDERLPPPPPPPGNTKAIDKSNSIRAAGCAPPARGGCAPRFVR
ncbi:TATA-box-binding protein-like [Anopheles merus]|uniref:TATA-box-binding protein-like n=1 Tax=Anopheles merus TaxID=30066 RepID=UPI001BE45633|nr:TATA-box-binding protein-like [Anopheles merus]XP_041767825.1 TATA-box-binding protein-like [Anopheles merus]